MNKHTAAWRAKSAAAALGSVRAEGLKPSAKTQKRLNQYVKGDISARELRRVTVQEMTVHKPKSKQ